MSVELPGDIFKQLKCFNCHRCISRGPVWTNSDGSNICGYCSPSTTSGQKVRNFLYEITVAQVKFPCRFNANGCEEQIIFNDTSNHEVTCHFKPLLCPLFPHLVCSWEGCISYIGEHFMESHNDSIVKTATIHLNKTKSENKVLIVFINNYPFMIEYDYNAETTDFKYYTAHFFQGEITYNYDLELRNISIPTVSKTIAKNICNFYLSLSVRKYSSCNLKAFINEHCNTNNFIINFSVNIRKYLGLKNVDFEMLANVQCYKCGIYATSPFKFRCGQLFCDLCSIDSDDLTKLSEIEKFALTLSYPCKWSCNFVGNSSTIRKHELNCKRRLHTCPLDSMVSNYLIDDLIAHCRKVHGCSYFIGNSANGKLDKNNRFIFVHSRNDWFVFHYLNYSRPTWRVYSSLPEGCFEVKIFFKRNSKIELPIYTFVNEYILPASYYKDTQDITFVLFVNVTLNYW